MPIYYDPTEARDISRLSQFVIQEGIALDGLEAATGADLLIHPSDKITTLNKPPGAFWHNTHCLLVQRKTGHDFFNSMDKLTHCLQRMLEHGPHVLPWLLVDGDFHADSSGNVVLDGKLTNWRWAAYEGALDYWQLRGGFVHWGQNATSCAEWLLRWSKNIGKLVDTIQIEPRPFQQQITGGLFDPAPWRQTLLSFPGLGLETANQIVEYVQPGKLAQTLAWMSDPKIGRPKGIGPKSVENWRDWLGLADDEALVVAKLDDDLHYLRTFYPEDFLKIAEVLSE